MRLGAGTGRGSSSVNTDLDVGPVSAGANGSISAAGEWSVYGHFGVGAGTSTITDTKDMTEAWEVESVLDLWFP